MKVYLLRHEKRYDIRHYETDLTEEGFRDADKLVEKLEELNIDIIFSSPYKRVIQTIEPYLKKTNKKINAEYGIYESLHLDTDNRNIKDIDKNLYGYQYINTGYKSIFKKDALKYGENFKDMNFRTDTFMKYLFNDNNLKNKNILIASHMSIINSILNRDEHDNYEMGKLSLFFDNGFFIKEL